MRLDADVERDVAAELHWSPEIDAVDIAVKVVGGEVTLTGFARTYLHRHWAEAAVRRVKGVAAIANDIQVQPCADAPTDPEIARAALAALKLELPPAWELITPTVKDGCISLDGAVEWNFQRERAESAIRKVSGVIRVLNFMTVVPRVAPEDIQHRIEDAFRRLADLDAADIKVEVNGSDVTLRGEVGSWAERDHAQESAWSTPGVILVTNELTVRTRGP